MKAALREKILEKRELLSKKEIINKSNKIKHELFSLPEYQRAKVICFFVSFNSEVDTHDMIKDAIKEGKRVCVPIATNHILILSEIKDFKELDKENKYGIMEPSKIKKINRDMVDMIMVPGTVFDKQCHRIGYGRGYYDGLLKGYKGVSIGICFDLQVVDKVPLDEWDEQLDKVITEEKIIN